MHKICRIIVTLLFLGSIYLVESEKNVDDELLAVAVYFRHGDRSPVRSFPTDQFFKIENFPMGFGQLTNKGINRQYELGQWLRNRYNAFLPDKYSPGDIYVRSTDIDRTLMSASANLAGLYPPKGDFIWNKNLLWRPIPIHTVPRSDDAVLAMKKSCPRWQKLYDQNKNDELYQKINEEHSYLYEYLSERTGLNVTDIDDVKFVRSVFYCYSTYNSSYIPSWTFNLNKTEVDYLAGLAYGRNTLTGEMKRLRAGPFLDYLTRYFIAVSNGVQDTPKFMMFSSHDTEEASVLDAMGVYDVYPPSFASTIIWELRKTSYGKYYLNLFYKNNATDLSSLVIPGCTLDCELEKFVALLESVTVNESVWEEECSLPNK